MKNITKFFDFMSSCAKCNIEDLQRIMSSADFDPQWCIYKADGYYSPLYSACMCGHPEIVELLLKYVDVIPNNCFQTACMPASDKRDNDFLKTAELLLKHGKFDKVVYYTPDLDELNDFEKQLKILFDEYMFRLDGPKYNENII